MDINKKTSFIILAVVIVIVFGLILYQYLGYKEQLKDQAGYKEQLKDQTDCEKACKGYERCIIICLNSDIIDKAVDEMDLSICEQLNGKAKNICIDRVYTKRAIEEDNAELCDNIIEKDFIIKCFDLYYYRKAKSTKDLSYCTKITNPEMKPLCEAIK